jgi:hypothetical protein
MADTTTANYHFVKPEVGASATTWGTKLNSDLDAIDAQLFTSSGALNANNLKLSNNPGTSVPGQLLFINNTVPAGQQTRWVLGEDTSPEVGGSAGSNLSLSAYSDTGTLLSTPLAINRASGTLGFGGPVIFNGTATFNAAMTLKGTTTNDNAATGMIGEVVSTTNSGGVGLTNGAASNIASISLSAGDWDVQGEVWFSVGTGGAGAVHAGINATSATLPGSPRIDGSRSTISAALTASSVSVLPLHSTRFSIAAITPVYLVGLAAFGSGAMTASGVIWARRAR